MIQKSLTFRLYPTKDQTLRLNKALDLYCELYNASLQERRDAWKRCGVNVSKFDQGKQLKDIWIYRPDFKDLVGRRAAEDVIRRVDFAFRAFFNRVKKGQTPGYPRFKPRSRYRSFSISGGPHRGDFTINDRAVSVSKIGRIRYQAYCEFPGTAKSITVKHLADGYYVTIVFECPDPLALTPTGKSIGIDLGMKNIIATSDGEVVSSQMLLKENEHRLRAAHRAITRKKKGSNRRKKAINAFARLHQKIARRRKHFLDNISRSLVDRYDVIGVEDLSPQKMGRLSRGKGWGRSTRRAFGDIAWGKLLHQIDYKALWAGRRVVKVEARGTSQECSECGERVQKSLSERVHKCTSCGLTLDRDINAARNIHQRALQALRGEEALSGPSVKREESTS